MLLAMLTREEREGAVGNDGAEEICFGWGGGEMGLMVLE